MILSVLKVHDCLRVRPKNCELNIINTKSEIEKLVYNNSIRRVNLPVHLLIIPSTISCNVTMKHLYIVLSVGSLEITDVVCYFL